MVGKFGNRATLILFVTRWVVFLLKKRTVFACFSGCESNAHHRRGIVVVSKQRGNNRTLSCDHGRVREIVGIVAVGPGEMSAAVARAAFKRARM